MKKFLLVGITSLLIATSFISCSKKDSKSSADSKSVLKIALVTDSGDITDQSFNQASYEACKSYAEANNMDYKYYKPSGDTTEARVASINAAVQDGYNAIVLPGYLFAEAIVKTVDEYSDIKFIALDVSEFDVMSSAEALGKTDWKLPTNVFCAVYAEEIPGFFAGYAAVKEGFKHLGFLGGMAVPAVIRYGYGFVQGANKAAEEMGNASEIIVEYVYGGQFFGDQTITAAMDGWYKERNVEVVFACGGGIWTSAAEAAAKTGGKLIGVDVDQSPLINKYADDMCVTSAMKGLASTVKSCLASINAGTFENEFGGKVSTLGLVSATEIDDNYVALPTASWSMKNFSVEDYKSLVADVFNGNTTISNDTGDMPKTSIKVNAYPNIK